MSDSNGVYRYLAVQLSQDSTTLAYDPVTRKSGEHTLGDTTGVDLLTNQDISLQDPEFQMVQHNPAADAWFISRSPRSPWSSTCP